MTPKNQNKLLKMLQDDQAALSFCLDFAFICEVFDDLYDKDKPVTNEQLEDALVTVLTLPENPFYRLNFWHLQGFVQSAVTHWIASNRKDTKIEHAHFFRYLGVQIWTQSIAIKRGAKEAAKLINEVWALSTMEPLEEFKNEMAA